MNLWAIFCLLVLSSYTANLAAVMVGEKTFEQVSGIHDEKVRRRASCQIYNWKVFDIQHTAVVVWKGIYTTLTVSNLASMTDVNVFYYDKHKTVHCFFSELEGKSYPYMIIPIQLN